MQKNGPVQESLLRSLLKEFKDLVLYYHTLILCGFSVSVFLFLAAIWIFDSSWIAIGLIILSIAIFAVSVWLYVVNLRQIKQEIAFFADIMGTPIDNPQYTSATRSA